MCPSLCSWNFLRILRELRQANYASNYICLSCMMTSPSYKTMQSYCFLPKYAIFSKYFQNYHIRQTCLRIEFVFAMQNYNLFLKNASYSLSILSIHGLDFSTSRTSGYLFLMKFFINRVERVWIKRFRIIVRPHSFVIRILYQDSTCLLSIHQC